MEKWTISLLMLPIVAISLLAVADYCDAEDSAPPLPGIASVEYVSVTDDGSFNPHMTVYLKDVTDPSRLVVYSVELTYGSKTITRDSKTIWNVENPSIDIDISKSVVSRLSDGQYTLTFSDGAKSTVYRFYVLTVDLKSNNTSFRTSSVQLSTDSTYSYKLPSNYLWNTENDGSGDWVTDVHEVTGGKNPVTLFAFKATTSSLEIAASTSTVIAGSTAKVLFSFTNNPGCTDVDITATYDSSVLEFKGMKNATSMTATADSSSPGKVTIHLVSTKTIRPMGSAVLLSFEVKTDADLGQYPVTITASALNEGKNVPAVTNGCTVIVGDKMRGDINDDGKVSDIDSSILRSRLAGSAVTASDSDMDVNDDGRVSVMDSLLMKKYIVDDVAAFADFDVKKVSMTIKEGSVQSSVEGVTVGSDVYISTDNKSVTASTSRGAIEVFDLGNGRYRFTAPSYAITVTIS